MTIIKRFQQGIFEGLASSNRAAGSGGGSGFLAMQMIAVTNNALAQTMTLTPYTDVPQCVLNFSVSRTSQFLVWASWYGKISARTGGSFAFCQLRLGSHTQVNDWGAAAQIFDNGLFNVFTNGASFFVATLQPGPQTAALQVGVDAGISYLMQNCLIAVFQLAY